MRGTAIALGMESTARDYGHEVKVALETDSVPGRGMSPRLRGGKVRQSGHTMDTQWLWVQGVFHRREATVRNIRGAENPRNRANSSRRAVLSWISKKRWMCGLGLAENEEQQQQQQQQLTQPDWTDSEIPETEAATEADIAGTSFLQAKRQRCNHSPVNASEVGRTPRSRALKQPCALHKDKLQDKVEVAPCQVHRRAEEAKVLETSWSISS